MPSAKTIETRIESIVFHRAADARMVNEGGSLFLGFVSFIIAVIGILPGKKDLVVELKNAQVRQNTSGFPCIVPAKRVIGGDVDVSALKHQLERFDAALKTSDADVLVDAQSKCRALLADTDNVQRRNAWYVEGETKALIESAVFADRGIAGALARARELSKEETS